MFHKITSPTAGNPQEPQTQHGVGHPTSRLRKSYLFESICLLWAMLFYLVLVVIWSKDKSSMHYVHHVRAASISSTAITLTGVFFCAPLCLIALGAATRSIHHATQGLHGPAQQSSQVARAFFHISWILFVLIQFGLQPFKS